MDLDASDAPSLTIETGLHRGATSLIALGETRVGAALESEISVSDVGRPVAFTLQRTAGALVVQAAGAPLVLGGKRLRIGRGRACRGSATLTSGPVQFRLRVPDIPAVARRPRGRWVAAAGAFAAGAACASMLTLALSLHAAPFSRSAASSSFAADATGSIPAVAAPVPAHPEPSGAALLGGLRRQTAAAGIETLDLRVQADGAIAANGTIARFQESAWHDIGRWFDAEAHGRFVLVDDVKVADAAPVLQIQAVWPGRNPYVVDGGGQKLFVGSTVTDGWTIRAIDRSRVLIRRGEQVVAVRF